MPNIRTDCRACHGTHLRRILSLAPTPIGDQFLLEPKHQPLHPIDLYQCVGCGLAQLLYEVPPEDLYTDYLYLTGSSPGLDEHFAGYAKEVAHNCGLRAGDLVVDIGSNDGTLLKHFKALGMEVLGFEPCSAIADIAERNGISTLCAYFTKHPDVSTHKVDLITANNVLANVPNLDAFMDGVMELLHEDGTFVFESFYLVDVIENMVFDFIYHEHLSAFSVRPVKRLLERYGLGLVRADRVKTKGGSIRYYCKRGPHTVHDDAPELYEPQTYIAFNARIEEAKKLTRGFLDRQKDDYKIAAFGASISGTTLMYHFGLGEYIDYIVDDNPAKQGRLSPGLHLPVHPMKALYKARPDYVLCLAWRFAEDFKLNHPTFNTITPLPRFQWALA